MAHMYSREARRRTALFCATAFIGLHASIASAQNAPTEPSAPAQSPQDLPAAADQAPDAPVQDIVVTGYRSSLAKSTNAKRESTGFTDSIFAEDIGKFPDTNIA